VPFYKLHNPGAPLDLRLGGLELTAFSISAVSTYVLVPAFDACFDLGHCAMEAARLRNVFLSHVHQDHAAGAPRHLALRQLYGSSLSRIYVPAESAANLVRLFRAFEALEEKPPADLGQAIRGVRAGDEVRLSQRYRVRAFDVVHRIASRGYTVLESRRTLRPGNEERLREELRQSRKRGEAVADVRDVPVFTYVGDSTIETLRRHPELGQSEVLFLEVTHLPGTNPAVSEKWGHTHLADLIALWDESPATLASPYIVLKHFSTRYKRSEIRAAIDQLPEELRRRVTVLV
jgi:ribonuclease BN (tRNA processing enzyme)